MEIVIYHLTISTIEKVLPQLIEKTYEKNQTCLLFLENKELLVSLNKILWTYSKLSFLPHSNEFQDLQAERIKDEKIFLTTNLNLQNDPQVIFNLRHEIFNNLELKTPPEKIIEFSNFLQNDELIIDSTDKFIEISKQRLMQYEKHCIMQKCAFSADIWIQQENGKWENAN